MKVIISGGGTGGHIFPAIAIADALKKRGADVLFVGAKGKMEMEKVPAAGFHIKGLWISGLQRRWTAKNVLVPFKILTSLFQAMKIINEFKPDAVIGVGGYASGPVVFAAAMKKIPVLIQEQNSFPGLTNRFLGKLANRICIAYDTMASYFPAGKMVMTGNPVRQDILDCNMKKSEGLRYFGIDDEKKTVLVLGGSLGAKTINDCIGSNLQNFVNENIRMIWQTGKIYFENACEKAMTMKNTIDNQFIIKDFISRMDLAYAVADVAVARAGAITISELCIAGKPAILVPSPNVAEDHQAKNAMALVRQNAAVMVTDADARTKLFPELLQLLTDKQRCNELSKNISLLARPDAAEKIADEVFKLC